MSVYTENGYKNRKEYLKSLAEDYGIPYIYVAELACVLGPSEDFDGLISEIENAIDSGFIPEY